MPKQMECRVIITHDRDNPDKFMLGMFDPVTCRHVPLGKHPTEDIDRIVHDLKVRMEREGHRVSFSETTGQR